MKQKVPSLGYLQPEKIQAVIDDLRLARAGCRLHYAVDPHEIFDFCFPMGPFDSEDGRRDDDIDMFAADQAALYEVFFKREEKPLLLEDYVQEINGLMAYSANALASAYDEAEVVNDLIEKGGLADIEEDERGQLKLEETVKLISEKFHIVLAVAMGIYSLGAHRFRSICQQLLVRGEGLPENDPELRPHFESYTPTKLADDIFRELSKSIPPALTEADYERKRRADRVDSMAVDRMVHVNRSLVRAVRAGEPPAHLVLYLSSAPRTGRIFGMNSTAGRLPRIDGKPLSFHRDRNHIFCYVVYRSDDGDLDQTIRNLEQAQKAMLDLKKFDRKSLASAEACADCVLSGGQPAHCDMLETCRNIQLLFEPRERRRLEIRNLGLAQTLGQYEELRKARPEGETQEKLMEFFLRTFDKKIKDVAKKKKLEKEKLIFTQRVMAEVYSRSRGLVKGDHARARDAERQEFLREGRDTITGTAQYLPLKPVVPDPRYAEIVELILDYYRTPPLGGEAKIEVIDRAYQLYFELEAQTTDLDPEHELVRCLLYLAMPSTEGDRLAYENAVDLLRQTDLLQHAPHTQAEFSYVACWAARRRRLFDESAKFATEAIEGGGADARFYHGRSLSKLAKWEWSQSAAAGDAAPPGEEQDRLLSESAEDARKAVELYTRQADPDREMAGANYNNLAYLYTLMAVNAANRREWDDARACLDEARGAIEKLKGHVTEDEWSPTHPTYYHTDAYLTYNECLIGGERLPDRAASLEHARRQIDKALNLNRDKKLYQELSHTIQNTRERWKG